MPPRLFTYQVDDPPNTLRGDTHSVLIRRTEDDSGEDIARQGSLDIMLRKNIYGAARRKLSEPLDTNPNGLTFVYGGCHVVLQCAGDGRRLTIKGLVGRAVRRFFRLCA